MQQKIWDYKKYRQIIGTYLNKEDEKRCRMLTRRNVYDFLSQETRYATSSAFQSWAKSTSPGPAQATLLYLEEYFNTTLTTTIEENNKEDNQMNHINQFSAEHTYNIIKEIKDFIHSDEVDSEDAFVRLCNNIEVESFCIPKDFEDVLTHYVNKHLEPLIYNHAELFGETPKFVDLIRYLVDIEQEFDELINTQIRPQLVL